MTPTSDLRLACARCGRTLVPLLGKWGRDRSVGTRAFRCPALSACGYSGTREDAVALELFRSGRLAHEAEVRLA